MAFFLASFSGAKLSSDSVWAIDWISFCYWKGSNTEIGLNFLISNYSLAYSIFFWVVTTSWSGPK